MISAILNEVENAGLLIAVSSCIVNALASGRNCALCPDSLTTYLPPSPHVYHAFCSQLAGADLPRSVASGLQELYARLELARKMAQMYVRSKASSNVKGGVHIDVLADTWRELCRLTLDVASHLRSYSATAEPAARWIAAANLLGAARDGSWPCIGDDGSVEVPGWAEQRRHLRWPVEWPARIHSKAGSWHIAVMDVSQGGFGLYSHAPIPPGLDVVLELATGRSLHGRLAWVEGERMGLMLASPLPADDPILTAARQPSPRRALPRA